MPPLSSILAARATKAAGDYNPANAAADDVNDAKIGKLQLLIFNATSNALEFNELIGKNETSKTVLLSSEKRKYFLWQIVIS